MMSHFKGKEFKITEAYKEVLKDIVLKKDHRSKEALDLYNLIMELEKYLDYTNSLKSISDKIRSILVKHNISYVNEIQPIINEIENK